MARIIAFFFILHLELKSVSGICEQPIPVECNTTDVIPWIRPCGTVLTTETAIRQQQQPQQRHSVHRSLKKVRMKMHIAHYSYMCFKKERQVRDPQVKDARERSTTRDRDSAINCIVASRRGKIAWAVARGGLARAHNATSPLCTILLSVGNLHWLRCVPRTSSIITFF